MFSFLTCGNICIADCKAETEITKNTIPIAMATDNNYIMPTIVAMTSILENKNENTFVDFHIMLSGTVTNENIQKLKKIENIYKNCSVDFINMKDEFSTARIKGGAHVTTAAYYRLNLSSLLPQYDKILYLDGDIIVTKDLLNLFNQDIDSNYLGGIADICQLVWDNEKKYARELGIKNLSQYINTGVLVMNLKVIRQNNVENKFKEFIPKLKKKKNLCLHDQEVINAVCYGKIKILKPKYNAIQITYEDKKYTDYASKHCYTMEELNEAITNPVVIHYAGGDKPWKSVSKCKLQSTWDKYYKIAKKKVGNI